MRLLKIVTICLLLSALSLNSLTEAYAFNLITKVKETLVGAIKETEKDKKTTISDRIEAKVTKVTDGDTVNLLIKGKEVKARLIGIDTPETVKPNSPVEPYGKEASDFTKKRLKGKKVQIEYDVAKTDKYGRHLVYIYLSGKMFNKTLLEEGYARVMTVPPNVKYAKDFAELEKKAREKERGLWGVSNNDTKSVNTQPPWKQLIDLFLRES